MSASQGIAIEKYCPTCGLKFAPEDLVTRCPSDGTSLLPVTVDPLIGQVIDGRTEVLALIGTGASSVVYRARQVDLGRMVAFKVLRGDLLSNPLKIQRFAKEARLIGPANHPNICAMYDMGTLPSGQPYIVLELVEGKSLASLLSDEGQLSVSRAIHLVTQIAAGLQEAHQLGVMHRDLKPGNIMVSGSGADESVKLIDFGLARALDLDKEEQLTTSGYIFGTPSYMSPEQVLGKALDERTDIYSLGCIFYEMLTGKKAIDGATAFDIMAKHVKSESDQIGDGLPESLRSVVLKCMQKEPEQRYQSVAEFSEALSHVRSDERVRLPRKAPMVAFALACFALLAVATGIFYASASSESPTEMIARMRQLEAKNKLDEAEALGKKTFSRFKSHGAIRATDVVEAGHLMERIYRRQSRMQELEPYIKAVFEAQCALAEGNDVALADAYHEAGTALLQSNCEKQSVPYLAKWLALVEKRFGKDSKQSKAPMLDLCHAEVACGMYKEAEQHYTQLLSMCTAGGANDDPQFVVLLNRELSVMYGQMGELQRASEYADKAVELSSKATAGVREGALERASMCAAKLGEFDKAYRLVDAAIKSIEKRRGKGSEEGLQLLVMRGRYLREAGNHVAADKALNDAVKRIGVYYTDGNLYKWATTEYQKNLDEMKGKPE